MRNNRLHSWILSLLCAACIAVTGTATGETVIDVWKDVKTPQAPDLKTVTLDSATTALLLLDFNKQVCNNERRPRCIASVPAVARLTERARVSGIAVVYSLTAGSSIGDVAPVLAARPGEPSVTSGPDKFLGTNLEKILKDRGITAVIVTGTAAHGAVLNTASGAAFRGLKVILPVDGLSAENLYAEQYTVWHLLNAPRVSTQTTVTRTDMITFK
ncbi:MAG: putative hydrolase [Syntrophorhabdus sp. PtaB.Bin047]|jgi:nicotinamidase-related amidase|nr:MAG: putative hydrolase [Syntrophorhabdus sp. PtaB.Bin047]